MTAKLGNKPSYAWRSIRWEHELFENGYEWRVGNVYNINIGSDPWIPREGIFRLVLTLIHIREHTVAIGRDKME